MQKKRTSDWAINPINIFLAVWFFQAAGNVLLNEAFSTFASETWAVLFSGTFAFLAGSGIAGALRKKIVAPDFSLDLSSLLFTRFCVFILFPLYIFFCVVPQLSIFLFNPNIALSEIRSSIVDSVNENNRDLIYLLYAHYSIVFLTLLAMCYASKLRRVVVVFVVLTGLLAGLLTFGRTLILLYFVSISIILYFQGMINKRGALGIGVSFVIMFFLLAFMLEKGDVENGWMQNVYWNFKVYFVSPLSAFNNYVEYGEPDISGSLLLPNFVKDFFYNFGLFIPATPNVLPFVEVPLPTNVYTAYFPWYHDGGILGVVFGFSAIGFLSSYLFCGRYKSRLNIFVYSISVYPLIMTIFEDQYLRSYTLWVLAIFWVSISIIFQRGCMIFREANK